MKILIAVIAYNEEQNIVNTLNDLINNNFGYDVVVIDNGSTDETASICKKMNIQCLSHCINSGNSSGTLTTYFMYANKNAYDVLCQFDGDHQHIASELNKIINPVLSDEADFVIGSRFLNDEGFKSYFFRRIGINIFSYLCSKILKRRITDVTSGFRCYNKKVIRLFGKQFRHEINDTIQLLLLAGFAGSKIVEVPVKMRERKFGVSEFNLSNAVLFPFYGMLNLLGSLLQKNNIKKLREIWD